MLEVKLASLSVVVISDGNNPRILNPDFLQRNQIVPDTWKPANVIVTSPFATVQFENSLSIHVENTKLQFLATAADVDWQTELPRIAIKYLEVLPHVAYKAVGLNFAWNSDTPVGQEAEDRLIAAMLRDGDWLKFGAGITGTLIELQYRKSQPFLALKIGVRLTVNPDGTEVLESYTISTNFHHDFEPKQEAERKDFITQLAKRQNESLELIKRLTTGVEVTYLFALERTGASRQPLN